VKDLTAELSYDDGRSWTRLGVPPVGKGRRTTLVAYSPGRAGEQVSPRVTAGDNAGGQVGQTVIRAYGVK
jgi:hypothetical protein